MRRLRGRHATVPPRVSVHTRHPWHWRALATSLLLVTGYALALWHLSYMGLLQPGFGWSALTKQRDLTARLVVVERQLQVERATRGTSLKEMEVLQGEIMKLKQDLAFYKGILAESSSGGTPKFEKLKLLPGAKSGEYTYQVGLSQAGRQDKPIRGSLQLVLHGTEAGAAVSRQVGIDGQQKSIAVNFKKYRQVEGTFSVPPTMRADSLEIAFTALGELQPTLTQSINFSN